VIEAVYLLLAGWWRIAPPCIFGVLIMALGLWALWLNLQSRRR